jgi:hypothetical protein
MPRLRKMFRSLPYDYGREPRQSIARTALSASHCGSKLPCLVKPNRRSASTTRATSMAAPRLLMLGAIRSQAMSKASPRAFSWCGS